jgi:hypothetical protein
MSDIVHRLRTACSPESPLGKLCSEAADVLAEYETAARTLALALTDEDRLAGFVVYASPYDHHRIPNGAYIHAWETVRRLTGLPYEPSHPHPPITEPTETVTT